MIKVTGDDGGSDKDVDDWTNSGGGTGPKVSDFINPANFRYCDTDGNISDDESEKDFWFGDNPILGVTISDDETTVTDQLMKFGLQSIAGIEHTEFKVKYDGSENKEGYINLDIYNNSVLEESAGLYIELADLIIRGAQANKSTKEKFSIKEYLDYVTSAEAGMELNVLGLGLAVGSTGAGLEVVTSFTDKNEITTTVSIGFDLADSISVGKSKEGPVEEDGYSQGITDSIEVNTGIVYIGVKALVGLTTSGLAKVLDMLGEGALRKPPVPVPG